MYVTSHEKRSYGEDRGTRVPSPVPSLEAQRHHPNVACPVQLLHGSPPVPWSPECLSSHVAGDAGSPFTSTWHTLLILGEANVQEHWE